LSNTLQQVADSIRVFGSNETVVLKLFPDTGVHWWPSKFEKGDRPWDVVAPCVNG
jgi:hypothetical protein